ncbi:MAG: hypothetical protein ACK6EB_24660 [Planctomyces sp.]|jgi:hypothetical protein
MSNRTTILLVYSFEIEGSPEDTTDHWEVCASMAEAERLYAEVLCREDLYSASICEVIKSTDYCSATCTHERKGGE